jgi:hypothetical protein
MELRKVLLSFVLMLSLLGCAGVHDNLKIPAGKIEGSVFTGTRYPFRVSVPSNWKMTTEFPDFLSEFGYEKPDRFDKEVTELYIFNPSTRSSIQIDFTPANPGVQFSQESIEGTTSKVTGSFKEELEKEFGTGVNAEYSPTAAYSLKGVPFAAKKYVTYTVKDVKREQGWIYAYAQPNQIFILYMILEKEGVSNNDREDFKKILDSFEVFSKK